MANSPNAPASLKARVITQAIAIVGFVIVPTLVTLMAPRSTITFMRDAEHVSVVVKRHALLFVPWQTRQIDHVQEIRTDITKGFRYGNTAENRRKDRAGAYNLATGQVAIVGNGPEVIVQADPELAPTIGERFDSYAKSTEAKPVTLTVYASWWLTYVLGGVCTFLAAFYLFGALAALVQMALRRGKAA